MPKKKRGGQKPNKRAKGKNSGSSDNVQQQQAPVGDINQSVDQYLGQPDIAKLIQDKIKAMESSQHRAQNAKILGNKDEILRAVAKFRDDFNKSLNLPSADKDDNAIDTSANGADAATDGNDTNAASNASDGAVGADGTDASNASNNDKDATDAKSDANEMKASESTEPYVKHFNDLCAFVERLNGVFYEMSESESSLKSQGDRLAQQNKTFKDLCHHLNDENRGLKNRIQDIEVKEKEWREAVDKRFQDSFSDIKTKIASHEEQYGKVVNENERLKTELRGLLEKQTKQNEAFMQYRDHQNQLTAIQEKEKENLHAMLKQAQIEHQAADKRSKEFMLINRVLQEKCETYETRFQDMTSTVQQSSNVIEQFKKMNEAVMAQNKDLSKKIETVMSRYKQLNSINDYLKQSNAQSQAKVATLTRLCRTLRAQNSALTTDFGNANEKLVEAGQEPVPKSEVKLSDADLQIPEPVLPPAALMPAPPAEESGDTRETEQPSDPPTESAASVAAVTGGKADKSDKGGRKLNIDLENFNIGKSPKSGKKGKKGKNSKQKNKKDKKNQNQRNKNNKNENANKATSATNATNTTNTNDVMQPETEALVIADTPAAEAAEADALETDELEQVADPVDAVDAVDAVDVTEAAATEADEAGRIETEEELIGDKLVSDESNSDVKHIKNGADHVDSVDAVDAVEDVNNVDDSNAGNDAIEARDANEANNSDEANDGAENAEDKDVNSAELNVQDGAPDEAPDEAPDVSHVANGDIADTAQIEEDENDENDKEVAAPDVGNGEIVEKIVVNDEDATEKIDAIVEDAPKST